MIALAIARFPAVAEDRQTEATKTTLSYLNSIGLTRFFDPCGLGIKQESYRRIQALAETESITVRVFHTLNAGVPATPEDAGRPFQGDETFNLLAMGELYYGSFHWDNDVRPVTPTPSDLQVGRHFLTAAAAGAWPVQTHAMQPKTMDYLLDAIAEVNANYPIRQLR